MIKKLIINKWFLLFFNASVFALMAWLLPIHFEQNDDVVMCWIASGKYSGTPDGHLVFINALLGWIIAGLYFCYSNIEWYALVFVIAHIIAITIIVEFIIYDRKLSIYLKCFFLLFLYAYWARIIAAFQFTTTAGLLCCAGCVALFNPSRKWWMSGVICILVASMIRFSAAAAVGLLFAPLFSFSSFKNKKFVFRIAIVLVLVGFVKLCDASFYMSSDWSAYKEYNAVRSSIQDCPSYYRDYLCMPNGVERLDYSMFLSFKGDPQVMTADRLQQMSRELAAIYSRNFIAIFRETGTEQLMRNKEQLAILLLGFLSIVVVSRKRLFAIAELIMLAVMLYYVSTYRLLHDRVVNCFVLPVMIHFILFDLLSSAKTLSILVASVFFLMFIVYIEQNVSLVGEWPEKRDKLTKQTFVLSEQAKDSEEVMVYAYSGPNCIDIPPFQVSSYPAKFVCLGWMTNSPLNNGKLKSHYDFVDSDILLFCEKDNLPLDIMGGIERNYKIQCGLEMVKTDGEYVLFKIVSQ